MKTPAAIVIIELNNDILQKKRDDLILDMQLNVNLANFLPTNRLKLYLPFDSLIVFPFVEDYFLIPVDFYIC